MLKLRYRSASTREEIRYLSLYRALQKHWLYGSEWESIVAITSWQLRYASTYLWEGVSYAREKSLESNIVGLVFIKSHGVFNQVLY